jgi:hypothetical protein
VTDNELLWWSVRSELLDQPRPGQPCPRPILLCLPARKKDDREGKFITKELLLVLGAVDKSKKSRAEVGVRLVTGAKVSELGDR